jgi:leucyl aminopeptidase (aminopeptidase T)
MKDFSAGARNAVRVCLGIGARDRVAVVRDREATPIAESIAAEASSAGAEVRSWTMEDWVKRPAREFPRNLADEVIAFKPTASYYLGKSLPGEIAFRQPLLRLLTEQLNCRHGHMPGIDEILMHDGMAGDYEEIYRVTRKVWEIGRHAARIDVTTKLGTELSATFSPTLKWIPADGRYHEQGLWGNLPEGETFTSPLSVDGVIAAEEIGDWFTPKYGVIDPPVRLYVKGGRLTAVETDNSELKKDIEAYLSQHEMSNRVGEFAIGTNVGLKNIVGNFLQDEKFPGVHMAFGDPYGRETGANWSCPSHVDVLASHATISVDGRTIMEDGRFLV